MQYWPKPFARNLALLVALATCLSGAVHRLPAQTVAVHGVVLTETAEPIVDSLVVPLAADFARPLLADTRQPMDGLEQLFQATHAAPSNPDSPRLLFAYTDREGRFAFQLSPGKYRFVAFRTPDSSAPPTPLAITDEWIELDGVSEPVDLLAADMAEVELRPLGKLELEIETKIPNDDSYLLLSRAPLAADPILGFAGWDANFFSQLVIAVRMKQGRCRLRGLPEGDLHAAVFANDNNPGFGATTIRLAEARVQRRIPIVASWSDGHKTPPEKLAPLVARFEREPSARQAVEAHWQQWMADRGDEPQNQLAVFAALQRHLFDPIELPSGETINFADGAAALAYFRLRQAMK